MVRYSWRGHAIRHSSYVIVSRRRLMSADLPHARLPPYSQPYISALQAGSLGVGSCHPARWLSEPPA